MILEMHSHTAEHSRCSSADAAGLVQRNFDQGLQGTVLTDHHYLWPAEELRKLRARVKVPPYYLILAGQEVDVRDFGHVLVFGADESISPGASLRDIRSRFPQAALVWAHPYRDEEIPSREKLFHPLIDGVEIFTSNHTVVENNRALRDWHEHKFTALSGTDTHAVSYSGLYPTLFDHPVQNVEELAAEIKAGRCRPFFREVPRSGTSNMRVMEITVGPERRGTGPEKFIIRTLADADTWRSAERTTSITTQLRSHGFETGRFRIPEQLGQDEQHRTIIEQAVQGKTLFDVLAASGREDARRYLHMTAEWLARLHNARLQITPPGEFLPAEEERLGHYLSAFQKLNHRQTRRAQEIMERVIAMENELYRHRPAEMVQGHGDYHPKNIFVGRDIENGRSFTFIAAIDFGSSSAMPPAFDVGTFLAQFRNQFYGNKNVLSKVSEQLFLEAYMHQAADLDADFLSQVELFMARTTLSICYYLIKVGLGDSENLWRVLVEAGNILTRLSVKE
jgi:hypothetical protein